MKQLLALAALVLLCAFAGAQTAVPTSRPHQNFVDNAGAPCALCKLSSFAAGTTTPQATYTDSSKTSQNTNPIILDIAGGANIWVDPNLSYKFVLKDPLGSTIWTVDNVKSSGGGAVPCSTPFTVQFANSDATALACDSAITIDPTAHSFNVGGKITGSAFTLKNLGTITASWTLDVTSQTTALNSLGPIPLGNLQQVNPDTFVGNPTGTVGVPFASPLPSCTNGINYSYSTHSWNCLGLTPLTQLEQQAPDTVLMNASGSTAQPTAVPLPNCANGSNYSTVTHSWTCIPSNLYNPTDHDVTFARAFGTVYQNTSSGPMRIYGNGGTSGSSVGSMQVLIGASSPSSTAYANTCTATIGGGACGFVGEVPAGWFYTVAANSLSGGSHAVVSVGGWHEVY